MRLRHRLHSFKKATKDVRARLEKLEKSTNKLTNSTNATSKSFAKSVVVANLYSRAISVLAQKIGQGFRSFLEFSQGVREINTLLDDSKKITNEYKEAFFELSNAYGRSTQEQTKAYYQIISAGISDTKRALDVLTVANKAAVGGLTKVNVAVDAITNVLNSYKGIVDDAEYASDVLFTTVKLG